MTDCRMAAFAAGEAARLADSETVAGRRLVWGEGETEHPLLCLVGEAPGRQEEEQGHPFVGKAGENLSEFLRLLGIARKDIWITNVVKVRPTKVSAKGTVSNRPPNRAELELFTPILLEELHLLQPQVAVTLGNTALQALEGKGAVIGERHGQPARCPALDGAWLFPLYHPASIIYNRALKETYTQDLLQLKAFLNTL